MPTAIAWTPWLAAAIVVAGVALVILGFLADYFFSLIHLWWYERDVDKSEGALKGRRLMRAVWFMTLYKWLPTPRIKLRNLTATSDSLYDGRMWQATTWWWNELLRRRPALMRTWPPVQSLDEDAIKVIRATLAPENRALLNAAARASAPFDTLSEASFALAYALARTWIRGCSPREDLQVAQPITVDNLSALDAQYGPMAALMASDPALGGMVAGERAEEPLESHHHRCDPLGVQRPSKSVGER